MKVDKKYICCISDIGNQLKIMNPLYDIPNQSYVITKASKRVINFVSNPKSTRDYGFEMYVKGEKIGEEKVFYDAFWKYAEHREKNEFCLPIDSRRLVELLMDNPHPVYVAMPPYFGIPVLCDQEGNLKGDYLATSDEWMTLDDYRYFEILDADGWDRANFQYSFYEERIDFNEFKNRFNLSTIQGKSASL